jgi:hypothetical protein
MIRPRSFLSVVALFLAFRFGSADASPISDVLVVADDHGFAMARVLTEADEAAGRLLLSINYPGVTLSLTENGGTSDTLTIPAFTVTLQSDANQPPPTRDIAERASLRITVLATSDIGVFSDVLQVIDDMGFRMVDNLTEEQEAAGNLTISLNYPGRVIRLLEDGSASDILTVPAFAVTLRSDANAVPPTLSASDPSEFEVVIIDVLAVSDVPSPSSLILVAIGLGCLVAYRWRMPDTAKGSRA